MLDLWPANLNALETTTPVSLLQQQAEFLASKTKDKITADVSFASGNDQELLYDFYLVVPALNNYHYRLFTIKYPPDLYPVKFYLDPEMGKELGVEPVDSLNFDTPLKRAIQQLQQSTFPPRANTQESNYLLVAYNENELVESLRKVLNSRKTMRIISSLLAQV